MVKYVVTIQIPEQFLSIVYYDTQIKNLEYVTWEK